MENQIKSPQYQYTFDGKEFFTLAGATGAAQDFMMFNQKSMRSPAIFEIATDRPVYCLTRAKAGDNFYRFDFSVVGSK